MRMIDADTLDFKFDKCVLSESDESYFRGVEDAVSVVNNAPRIGAILIYLVKVENREGISTNVIVYAEDEKSAVELVRRDAVQFPEFSNDCECNAKQLGIALSEMHGVIWIG